MSGSVVLRAIIKLTRMPIATAVIATMITAAVEDADSLAVLSFAKENVFAFSLESLNTCSLRS